MDRAASQDLASLLPTVTTLPPELVELASSLFAQSRIKATSLKQDEEVARSYACAHIACERLKTRLDLPAITARPPCAPRVYKKLYAFLDSALQSRRPRNHARDREDDPSAAHSLQSPATAVGRDAKRRRQDASLAASPGKRQKPTQRQPTGPTPDHSELLPLIRGVCDALGSKAAVPHVYTGVRVQAIAFDSGRHPALVIAVAVTVLKKLGCRLPARPLETAAAVSFNIDGTLRGRTMLITSEEDCTDDLVADASALVDEHDKDWRHTEWFHNVQTNSIRDGDAKNDLESDAGLRPGGDDDDLSAVISSKPTAKPPRIRKGEADDISRPGLGTMFCDALDWLNDDRRAAYVRWKRDIMARVESLA